MNSLSETAKFTDDILSVAKTKAQQIIAEAENEKERQLQEAKITISKESADLVRNAEAEAEAVRRRIVSEVRHRLKMRAQQEKDKILSEVLRETKKRVMDFARDENRYTSYIVNLITDAIRELGLDSVTIHMNAEDLKRLNSEKIIQEIKRSDLSSTKLQFSKNPINASGGVIVSNSDETIKIVNTFEQHFEALEPKLLIEAGKLLFS